MKKPVYLIILSLITVLCTFFYAEINPASAMPFYDLAPKSTVLRAEYLTTYSKSSEERKHNIALAAKSINGTVIPPYEIFSFNCTVGARTVARGYRKAKIISGGTFTDGVGGGVCQVSTTLYNAALRAGLSVCEYHAHSLGVKYVAPSTDAMVNSGYADLKIENCTHNPVIIRASANGTAVSVKIYGEPLSDKIVIESVVNASVSPESPIIKEDTENLFPDLKEGEERFITYPENGTKSKAYIATYTDSGKLISKKLLRSDYYRPIRGVKVKKSVVKEELS